MQPQGDRFLVRKLSQIGRAALVTGLLAGCEVGPDYVRPQVDLPETFRAQASDPALPQPPSRWWTEFRSPELDALVDEALANNHDLKIAVHRIAQAQARAGSEAGALLPTLDLAGSAEGSAPKGGIGSTRTTTTQTERSARDFQIGLEASYEVDLWGKNRSAMEAALATAQASVFNRETVAHTLVADIATSYFQYLQACDRRRVAAANVDNMLRVLAKVKRRREVGEGSDLEVAQQQAMLAQAEATLPILQLGQEQAFNRLALLLGRAPAQVHLECKPLEAVPVPPVRPGVPSEVLLRRPDIRKAEADMVAANADIGKARANLFPSLTLTAERGYGSTELINLMSPTSMFWSLAANLAAPIFDNGRRQAEVAFQEARWGEMVETYRKAIAASLRDVEDALAAMRFTTDREAASIRRLDHARDARRLSERSFAIGTIDYLSVLETERTQYNSEDELIQARFARLSAAVALFKAMGGGLDEDGVPAAAEPTRMEAKDAKG